MRKKLALPKLKKKLWRIFSEYTRKKYADEDGMVKCISCPSIKHWKEVHAGHYIPKSLGLSIYFEEKNVHPQCVACNLFMSGNLSSYAIELRKKYGENILEELNTIKNREMKLCRADYESLIEKYSKNRVVLG